MRWFGKEPNSGETKATDEMHQDTPGRQQSAEERLMDRANTLAKALQEFEQAVVEAKRAAPTAGLREAEEKVRAAEKIVRDGNLGNALCRHLWEEIRTWHAWIKREDFPSLIHFDCSNVEAKKEQEGPDNRHDRFTVSFDFNDRRYTVVVLDKGWSMAPDANHKWGEIEFYAGEERVLWLNITQGFDDWWRPGSLKGFKAKDGEWMKDLITMCADLDQKMRRRIASHTENAKLDAAKNIEL